MKAIKDKVVIKQVAIQKSTNLVLPEGVKPTPDQFNITNTVEDIKKEDSEKWGIKKGDKILLNDHAHLLTIKVDSKTDHQIVSRFVVYPSDIACLA